MINKQFYDNQHYDNCPEKQKEMGASAVLFIILRFCMHVVSFHDLKNIIVCSGLARSKKSAQGANHRVDTNLEKN